MTSDPQSEQVRAEFQRTASVFTKRTAGRYADMDVVEFSRVAPGGSVLEVGVGTGVFLSQFADVAGSLTGLDLSETMLQEALRDHPKLLLVQGDGRSLPFRSKSFDLTTSAQTLHHVPDPLPVVMEMRRVTTDAGQVLIVDQVATERYEEAVLMTQLDLLRDPSHAASRPPSALRTVMMAAGLAVVGERIVESRERLAAWMPAEEFPAERIEQVRDFVARLGTGTGMEFRAEGDDHSFTRRRMMLLARRAQ